MEAGASIGRKEAAAIAGSWLYSSEGSQAAVSRSHAKEHVHSASERHAVAARALSPTMRRAGRLSSQEHVLHLLCSPPGAHSTGAGSSGERSSSSSSGPAAAGGKEAAPWCLAEQQGREPIGGGSGGQGGAAWLRQAQAGVARAAAPQAPAAAGGRAGAAALCTSARPQARLPQALQRRRTSEPAAPVLLGSGQAQGGGAARADAAPTGEEEAPASVRQRVAGFCSRRCQASGQRRRWGRGGGEGASRWHLLVPGPRRNKQQRPAARRKQPSCRSPCCRPGAHTHAWPPAAGKGGAGAVPR
jgi:hypothetical protein